MITNVEIFSSLFDFLRLPLLRLNKYFRQTFVERQQIDPGRRKRHLSDLCILVRPSVRPTEKLDTRWSLFVSLYANEYNYEIFVYCLLNEKKKNIRINIWMFFWLIYHQAFGCFCQNLSCKTKHMDRGSDVGRIYHILISFSSPDFGDLH